jgi:prolipoprotein diacylglyceryltransferase
MKLPLIIVAAALLAVLVSITFRSWRREPGIYDNPFTPLLMAVVTGGIIGALIGATQ